MIVKIVVNETGELELHQADRVVVRPAAKATGPGAEYEERWIDLEERGGASQEHVCLTRALAEVKDGVPGEKYQIYVMNDNGKTVEAIYW